ncbi:hypothetical protein [Salipaludibacillus neizhouensis]|nr:hypothetical protein [Salipaludibacillus neizhouensis]
MGNNFIFKICLISQQKSLRKALELELNLEESYGVCLCKNGKKTIEQMGK